MYDTGFREASKRIYNFTKSIRKTSYLLKIAKSTFQRWRSLTNNSIEKRSKISQNDVRKCVIDTILDNPFVTCTELSQSIFVETGTRIARQLVSIAIKTYGFSKIKARNIHVRHDIQLPRMKAFLNDLIEHTNKTIVAVDECGFDSRMIPFKGYCKRGNRLRIADHRGKHWTRRNCIMSVSTDGSCNYEIHDAPVDGKLFSEFIMKSDHPRGSIWILDNVSFHKSGFVLKCMEEKGFVPVYIPPYCPDANPIENIFGIIKNSFRTRWIMNKDENIDVVIHDAISETAWNTSFVAVFRHAFDWVQSYVLTHERHNLGAT